jgi:glc operon protein GlcG
MKSPMICSVAMVVALVGFSPVARALDQVPNLSLDLARKMAAGCEAKAKEMNWKMNISVVDSGFADGNSARPEPFDWLRRYL